jgi:hypothetical protein
MIVTRGLGLPASTLVAAGLGLTAALPPVHPVYEEERGSRRHRPKPDLNYDPRILGQLKREDNELIEIVTMLVTRILK